MKKVAVIDFGSQYTQLIARRVREQNVYSEILPYSISLEKLKGMNLSSIILSGGPASVYEKKSPNIDKKIFELNIPILGICYGLQIMISSFGGRVINKGHGEYGFAKLYPEENSLL